MVQFRTARRKAFAAAALLGLALKPIPAVAYDAWVAWEPSAQAAGYTLFIRYAGSADASPIYVGSPAPDTDGLLRVVVEALPLLPGAYFSVAAYDDAGTQGTVSRELSISYQEAAAVTDSDNDGLTDAQEDADPNATVDAGETDPNDADSDDDGFTDGSEVLVHGTDPLDPTSAPACTDDCEATCTTSCDDENACTLDLCELGTCVHVPATAPCDDGVACTSFDACHDGTCSGVGSCSGGATCDTTLGVCTLEQIWFAGAFEPTLELRGKMTHDATYAGGADDDPSADSLAPELLFVNSTTNSLSGGSGDEARFQFTLPTEGQWYLWGRFYYPGAPGSNDANSFLARVDGGSRLRFGNNKDYFRRWHWGGNGAIETGTPTPLSLGTLSAGVHTLIVEKREATPIPPRLDVFMLTTNPDWRPTDEAALAALSVVLPSPVTTTTTTLPPPTTTTLFPPPTTSTTLTEPEPTTTSTLELPPETSTTTTLELPPETTTSTTLEPAVETTTTTTTTTLPPPPPPECIDSTDCEDGDVCTTDSCTAGECIHAQTTGTPCNDGDACTVGDACASGTCVGWTLDCSHLDGQCTYGVCDPQLAECAAAPHAPGTACDDGSACTTGDVCDAGVCRGTESCAAGSYCDAATKSCKLRSEIWLSAALEDTALFSGAMTSSTRYADGDDVDVAADSIEPLLVFADSTKNDNPATSGDRVSYLVELPTSGPWYLWGRFYYPGRPGSNDANSFNVRVDGGSAMRFGNNKGYFRQWHWDGDGRVENGAPVALSLGELAAGPHTLTIIKREVSPIPPRLDVLVLTPNPDWIPTDADIALP